MEIVQIRATILFIGAFLDLILVLILWFKGKSRVTFHLGLGAFFSALYCFTYGSLFFFEQNKLFWSRATWVAILIVASYVAFAYAFIGKTKYFKLKASFWYGTAIIIYCLALITPYFIVSVDPEYPFNDVSGVLEPWGRLYGLVGITLAFFTLLKKYFKSKGFRRLQLKYFVLGIGIHTLGGFFAGGVLPLFYPKFNYIDISAILTVPGVSLTTYAIFKRRLFAIRVILTEILVGSIGVILLIQALLTKNPTARILDFIAFFSFLAVGYLLIKTTQKEIQRKEEAEKLAKKLKQLNETLEQRVKERTKELQERIEELERFHKLTVGRELKMIELKKEIAKLKEELKNMRKY